ncbi:MAG TPA: helix-turn-helix transcriptional regulator [Anaerolineaceae bacterium]
MEQDNLFNNITLELRRGVIVLAVLNHLQKDQYGYSILKSLSEQGLEVDQGTLYPLLRRLEGQGLLQSSWRVEGDRPRRYYVISPTGASLLERMKDEWNRLVETLNRMLSD